MARQIRKLAAAFALLSGGANAAPVEVVVAHYNEDLSWLSRLAEGLRIRIYTKGSDLELSMAPGSDTSLEQLSNVGRESHTYLSHIVKNYEHLADWTVFTQAGKPSFGYKGHRSGGGHLLAGDNFANYLVPTPSGSRFVHTGAVHLPSMNHLLRAAYCINDDNLEDGDASTCPKEASLWTPWWDIGDFRKFLSSKVQSQHGKDVMDFYRKYINPAHKGDELTVAFPQGARFAVSRETIQRRPKADYEKLLAALSNDEDSYAGYFMEWFWSELLVGHQQQCSVPAKVAPMSHAEAMDSLVQRFPKSMKRQLSVVDETPNGSIAGGISGGISGGVTTTGTPDSLSGATQHTIALASLLSLMAWLAF